MEEGGVGGRGAQEGGGKVQQTYKLNVAGGKKRGEKAL